MATAPELLDALIGLSRALTPFNEGRVLLESIEELIARAEGRK
jgi:hypothetical protein